MKSEAQLGYAKIPGLKFRIFPGDEVNLMPSFHLFLNFLISLVLT